MRSYGKTARGYHHALQRLRSMLEGMLRRGIAVCVDVDWEKLTSRPSEFLRTKDESWADC